MTLNRTKALILCALSTLVLTSCGKDKSSPSTPAAGGFQAMEGLSCAQFSESMKKAVENVLNSQDSNFYKRAANEVFAIESDLDECHREVVQFKTLLHPTDSERKIYVSTTSYPLRTQCGMPIANRTEAKIDFNDLRAKTIATIAKMQESGKIETDRPCNLNISSSKDHLTIQLFVDGKTIFEDTRDFRGMEHPGEIRYRLNKINYTKSFSTLMLSRNELNAIVQDCSLQDRSARCLTTSRPLGDFLNL